MLPRPYISYSSYHLWKKDKDAFRRKYYEGEKAFETVETVFGKKIAKFLEERHVDYLHIPHYEKTEFQIEVDLGNLKLMGYLDSFDPVELQFLDHKTGHANKDGKPPWDQVKVQKHEQLVFYSMLIKLKYGKVKNDCKLVWLETEFVKKKSMMGKHELEAQTRELRLTGQIKIFKRNVKEWERKKLQRSIKIIAKEIQDDYESYQRNKELHERLRKVELQKIAQNEGRISKNGIT